MTDSRQYNQVGTQVPRQCVIQLTDLPQNDLLFGKAVASSAFRPGDHEINRLGLASLQPIIHGVYAFMNFYSAFIGEAPFLP